MTNISTVITHTEFNAVVQFNAVGSCNEHCTFFMRWRLLGTDTWSNGPQHSVGAIGETRWHETVEGLAPFEKYEYQTCGKEDSWSSVVCVGPNGSPGTTDKFSTNDRSTDWAQFGYDYAHTSASRFELTLDAGNVSQLTQTWYGLVPDATSPSVGNGVVYVGGRTQSGAGLLAAYPVGCRIDGGECQRLWTANAGTGIAGSTPAFMSPRVFIGSEDGKVYAFNAANGSLAWTGPTGGPIRSPVTVGPGLVYAGSGDGKVYAFKWNCGTGGATCTPVWKTGTFGAITSSPAYDPIPGGSVPRVFAGSADHHLYAFNASQGGIVWTASTGGAIHSSPTVANEVVYVGSDDGKLYAFQSDCPIQQGQCQPKWTATTGGPITGSPAVADPDAGISVYVGSGDGNLYAYSASCGSCQGGQLQWKGVTGGAITSQPAVANGVVYVGSEDGKLYAFDADGCGAATCQPLFTKTTAGSPASPAVASGDVYLRDQAGVRAYGLP